MGQVSLLSKRAYWPLFWTQFFGAFNDNVFKNALVIMVAYRAMAVFGANPDQIVILAGGVFILPFFLFSPLAGQLCDRYPKTVLIRAVKLLEIAIMLFGALGFILESGELLLVVLFLMGSQSTLFGPAKYSILPELVSELELVGANALVEMGTFVAILLGTIVGGVLIALGRGQEHWTALSVVVLAIVGAAFSRALVPTEASDPSIRITLNPVPVFVQTWRILRAERSVLLSVMGISWFWFLGASILSLMPVYCRDVLRGNESVVTGCLALFCVGIGLGSVLCERLSQHRLELGLVPVGSLGLSLFLADWAWSGNPYSAGVKPADLIDLGEFLGRPGALRIGFDLLMIALFGGIFSVPLYTLIQQRSPANVRSRVIAGNNILNAIFMVVASLVLVVLGTVGLSQLQIFGVLCAMNIVVAIYIYAIIPEFLLRFAVWGLSSLMYRLKVDGREHIPAKGACILVCNHVSFIDWMLIAAACPRPARFVMYHGFLKLPLLGLFFRDAKVIPIAPAHEDAAMLDEAFDRIAEELEDGEVVCLFPEGKLTLDGKRGPFRNGIEKVVARTPVPVIPMALSGLWGSFFSKRDGAAFKHPFRRFWSKVELHVGAPVPPDEVTATNLGTRVDALLQARSGA